MAIRQRQRGRPQGRSNSFQRRLTWREVETAFNYLFDVGLDNDEAERIVLRFRRARSQLLPLFSGMVVSPYEQERLVALTCLGKMGGATTAKMLDDVLADIDVHEAFKRDVRQLRETISPEPQPDEEGDEELEEVDTELGVEGEDEDELEFEPAAETDATEAEAETTAESEPTTEEAREPSRSRRRSRGRGRRREPQEQAPPPVTIDPNVFEAAPEAFLTALDGPIEPLLTAFAELPLPKRLSFIDRSGRLDDARVLRFLVPLLETEEWALVQSALRAIQTLGRVEALEVVERLAADSGRKRVKLRAERVRDHLRELAAAAPPAPAEPQPEPES
ncbi:MAG: HEAT repeat domain-containing protein, partial [Armatimonadetes bacterium]|nr:HEAT repeat domain-containing protein [Armatimonadota bacterium]